MALFAGAKACQYYYPEVKIFVDLVEKHVYHLIDECKVSTLAGLSVTVTFVATLNLLKRAFFSSLPKCQREDKATLLLGAALLTASAFNPFPHARTMGAVAAVASFFFPRPKSLM
jgi:hypothetical protein